MKKNKEPTNFNWFAEDEILELFNLKDAEILQIRLIDEKGNDFIVKDVSDISISYTKENGELTLFTNVMNFMTHGISND